VLTRIINIGLTLGIGLSVTYLLAFLFRNYVGKKLSLQSKMLIYKGITYTGLIIILFIILKELGVKLSALLGAAGVVGIILGIASQTSIGNIISGIFLVSEKTFELGDIIKIEDKIGVVYSIDLLSIKIRTFDNLLLRIPNQKVIGSDLTNITKFPIRRLDFKVSVAYKEDLERVHSLLLEIAKENPLCLDEPEPFILFKDFGNSGINILFGVWFEKQNYISVKNSVFKSIKKRFDDEGIEIPFPHLSLYMGEKSKPMAVKIVNDQNVSPL
jgi:small-conductance mechanosensitive channel